jgi:hypothetical protein
MSNTEYDSLEISTKNDEIQAKKQLNGNFLICDKKSQIVLERDIDPRLVTPALKTWSQKITNISPTKFESLPIISTEWERNGEWTRPIQRTRTIAELCQTWNIDDPSEMSEMAQVLRYLRDAMTEKESI